MKWGTRSHLMAFFSREWGSFRWFLPDGYAEAFYPNAFCYIENLNNSIEDHVLVRPNDERPHFLKSDEGLSLPL